jgi:hypothetical protein
VSDRRFGFLILLAFEEFLTLALIVAVPLVLLSMEEWGFVPMLLFTWFVFTHHDSLDRSSNDARPPGAPS